MMSDLGRVGRTVFGITIVLWAVSFLCLILYYLALTDIWHDLGSPDFWHGKGKSSLEWLFVGVCYWPMFLFHLIFMLTVGSYLKSKRA